MDDSEWLDDWATAIAKLAHSTMLLLAEGEARIKFELGRFATEHSVARASNSSEDPALLSVKLANVALGHLVKSGFVLEHHKKFRISPKGRDALERYPDVFSLLFVQRELLK